MLSHEAKAMLEAAQSVAKCLHSTVIHEEAHGKNMGQHGEGYKAACDDILGWLEDVEHMKTVFADRLEKLTK